MTKTSTFNLSKLLILAMVAVLVFVLAWPLITSALSTISYAFTHADKHGAAAIAVRFCLNNSGPIQRWHNPNTGRIANLCEIEPGKFGIQIVEPDANGIQHEITAFVKDKFTRIEQVVRYLKNTGYEPIP